MSTPSSPLLLNPQTYLPQHFDDETRRLLAATIEWFEARGLRRLTEDFHAHTFYRDFLDFVAKERLFATLLTPAKDAAGETGKRWDTARIAAMSEVLGFYGLNYWYPWQVTVLGLGPVWQSDNDAARVRTAQALDAGGVAAFGLSEQSHGADIYSTDLVLTPTGDGGYLANGAKYYIGNGNCATTVSVFGRIDGVTGPEQYVFFRADSTVAGYHVIKNVVPSQMYVAEFRLEDYRVENADILHTGEAAFSAALNTVNIGKFNLCFGGIGLATHALYEAVTHAHRRVLYGQPVTAMAHVRSSLVEAYARLIAMRLFSDRAVDYFRSADLDDRRYLLFNPITKMKVTTEAETVLRLLGDVVAAKGFEADNFLTIAKLDVSGLPKLEGTVAVNLALVLKFMPAYLFEPVECPVIAQRLDAADDEFLFRQGPARGLGKIRFHDWRSVYGRFAHIPNVAVFTEQIVSFADMVAADPAAASGDLDFALAVGELFTLIVYGQLILEQAEIAALGPELLGTVFDVLVRDFSARAVDLHAKAESTPAQQAWALSAVRKPVTDTDRFAKIWDDVVALVGAYEMRP